MRLIGRLWNGIRNIARKVGGWISGGGMRRAYNTARGIGDAIAPHLPGRAREGYEKGRDVVGHIVGGAENLANKNYRAAIGNARDAYNTAKS